ncbi:dTMP kinase [Paucidesulfovibrio gracilis DSM 16080]|uniref:Thymidylate kinase n=1 Tax=Paucidesulfovibrio gracilis DSM 16080 TaxID=1121449 RepID=A0A1T4WTI9_9BACT|nr:dTMP kinase [Paucidesulfovibrio gracilis]SKA80634.1 dTMP kinase [Paucidesulfovibrio gracilis DSM 16080]
MFITFEGIEGTGKSTQIRMLVEHFKQRGQDAMVTLEPGGSRIGKELRRMLLHLEGRDITPETELFLYLADRAQHAAQVIRPALQSGKIVISDRYADSTVVYQGYGRGLDPRLLHQLNEVAVAGCWPHVTILLDLEPETGLNRAMARNLREGKAVEEGRFEAESLEFHKRVREGYLTWAALHQDRIEVVDATPGPDEVFESIRTVIHRAQQRH